MMGLNCEEVTRRLASDQLTNTNWRGRFVVGFHLFLCDKCRGYKNQLEMIGKAAKDLWPQPENDDSLRRLQDRILNRDSSDLKE